MRVSVMIVTISLVLFITSCAKNVSSNTYDSSEVGVASKVVSGVVVSKRIVNIDANSGAGGVAGVVAGAGAGSAVGGSSAGNIAGMVGGAVVGGLMGNSIDKAINKHLAFEYIIKLDKGNSISVVQAQDVQLDINQRALIIYGAKTRVIPNTNYYKNKSHV